MSWLSLLLIIKIGVTILFVAAPFLLLPKQKLEALTKITAPNSVFFRLYGVAVTALVVGYAFGIPSAEAGVFPHGVVWMGIVSNSGASVLLLTYARGDKQNRALGIIFGLIALGLIAAMISPVGALQKVW
ncbi:MAG: hypothetical protein JWM78_1854 [Verrucomicrobiaceae bacterium]|nr:hypothetical protein [Verrucomicrobiaceae bacterium]